MVSVTLRHLTPGKEASGTFSLRSARGMVFLKVATKKTLKALVRFQVLTAASMMFRAVFWVVLPCKMIVDQFTRQYNPEDSSEHLKALA
jgi:hypothetical protein